MSDARGGHGVDAGCEWQFEPLEARIATCVHAQIVDDVLWTADKREAVRVEDAATYVGEKRSD